MTTLENSFGNAEQFPALVVSFRNLFYAQKEQDLCTISDILESLIERDFALSAQGITNLQKQNRVREIGGIATLVLFLSLPSSYFFNNVIFEVENEIKKNVIVLLHCLCVKNPLNKNFICDTGILPILIKYYEKLDDSDMVEVVIALLNELLTNNLPMQIVFQSLRGIPLLLWNTRRHWQYNQFIAEKELHLLDQLICTSSYFHDELCNGGVISLLTEFLFKTTSLSLYCNKETQSPKSFCNSTVTEQEDMFLHFTTLSSSFDNIDNYETLAQAKARGVHEVEKCPQNDMRLYCVHSLYHFFSTSPVLLWKYFIPNNGLKPLLALLYNLEMNNEFAGNVLHTAEYCLRVLLLVFQLAGYDSSNDASDEAPAMRMLMKQFINENDDENLDIEINCDLDVIQLQGIPALLHILYLSSESLFLMSQYAETKDNNSFGHKDELLLSCMELSLKVLAATIFWEKVLDREMINAESYSSTVPIAAIEVDSDLNDQNVQEQICAKYSSRVGKFVTRHCGVPCLASMLQWQAFHLDTGSFVLQDSSNNRCKLINDLEFDNNILDLSGQIVQLLLFVTLFLPGCPVKDGTISYSTENTVETRSEVGKFLLYENADVISAILSFLPERMRDTFPEQFSIITGDTKNNMSNVDEFVRENMEWFKNHFPCANQSKNMVHLHALMAKILFPDIVANIMQCEDLRQNFSLSTTVYI